MPGGNSYERTRKAKKVFTTGQIAKICRVAPRTVSKWFDAGRLKGYRIPSIGDGHKGGDRRVTREELIKFLEAHGMPLGELREEETTSVLAVGLDERLPGQLSDLLPVSDGFRLMATESVFDAGLMAHDLKPAAVVVDAYVGRQDLLRMVKALRSNGSADSLIVAVVGEDFQNEAELTEAGYDRVCVRPVDPAALAGLIRAGREG